MQNVGNKNVKLKSREDISNTTIMMTYDDHLAVSKNRGYRKMDGENNGKPY